MTGYVFPLTRSLHLRSVCRVRFLNLQAAIAIDDSVAWASVSQSVTREECAKTVQRIEVLFGMKTLRNLRNTVLNRGLHPHNWGERIRCGLCQITLATCCASA